MFYKPAQYWINKIFIQTKKLCTWATDICAFKMDVKKWWLYSVILKSNAQDFHLKSQKWFQTEITLHSDQFPLFIASAKWW